MWLCAAARARNEHQPRPPINNAGCLAAHHNKYTYRARGVGALADYFKRDAPEHAAESTTERSSACSLCSRAAWWERKRMRESHWLCVCVCAPLVHFLAAGAHTESCLIWKWDCRVCVCWTLVRRFCLLYCRRSRLFNQTTTNLHFLMCGEHAIRTCFLVGTAQRLLLFLVCFWK